MKVTFVHTSALLNLRGSEIWLMDVCNLLANDSSFQVRVINFDYDRRYPKTHAEISRRNQIIRRAFGGVSLVRLSALRLRTPLQRSAKVGAVGRFIDAYLHFIPLNRQFFRCLRDSDVIYYMQSQRNPAYLIVVMAASLLSGHRPVIAGVHVTPRITPFDLAILKIFSKIGILKGIHLVDRTHESSFRKAGCGVEYIPNGVYYEKFYSNCNEKLTQKEFSILFVGAMNDVKGADMLPDIYIALNKLAIPFTLNICTSGGELSEQIRNWSKGKSNVDFKGFVERDELAKLYRESSVALFPSKREAFPLACLEAQASGTPVVASDIAGFRQAVIDGLTGLLVSEREAELFAEKIAELYTLWKKDRTRYVSMCENAQGHVRDNFQWKHTVKRLSGLFEAALN